MTLINKPENVGITIPEYAPLPERLPFVHYVRVGDIVYLSGHIPDMKGTPALRGRLGEDVDLETGREAARRAALNLLSTLREAVGDLDSVRRIVKLTGFVASGDAFIQQPEVINAASAVFVTLWGEAGVHSRSAIGVAQLPLGVPVEIELIVETERD